MHRPIMSLLSVCMSEDVSLICVCMDYILAKCTWKCCGCKIVYKQACGGGGLLKKICAGVAFCFFSKKSLADLIYF